MRKIYFAAGLFKGGDTLLNLQLTRSLEMLKQNGEKKYQVILPQRDGFEFGRLGEKLSRTLDSLEVEPALQMIIHTLDIGKFIPESDYVVARCDEPLDSGVDIELGVSHFLGKPTIGYRTDVTSPFGSIEGSFGGMHFFPGFTCDAFIHCSMSNRTQRESNARTKKLVQTIDETLVSIESNPKNYRYRAPARNCIIELREAAELLFSGIDDIHSVKGMKEIARRYAQNKDKLHEALYPKIIRV
jgi:nucleoside 2-deoxyribosyltransferase